MSLQPASASGNDPLLLLVEDDPDDAHLLRRAFRRVQPTVQLEHVQDGEQAVARLADQEAPLPAVVLLDLKLPRMSGFEVLGWIRADPRVRRVPVIILTSSRMQDDVGQAYDLGANSYLMKPTAPEALMLMMADVDRYWFSLNERPPPAAG